jgi:hypothetical protein
MANLTTPEKRTKLVKKEYWACNVPDHTHLSETCAMTCIKSGKKGSKAEVVRHKERLARNVRIVAMFDFDEKGFRATKPNTLKSVGKMFGLSAITVRGVAWKYWWRTFRSSERDREISQNMAASEALKRECAEAFEIAEVARRLRTEATHG